VLRFGRIASYALRRAVHVSFAPIRAGFRRYMRAEPADERGQQVTILLLSAWGMGGTTRTVENVAAYLARAHDVEVLSLFRRREKPFFDLPPGVTFTALDDRRPSAASERGLARRLLAALPSALVHPADAASAKASLWTDLALVRKLRGRSGFLLATRPGFNLAAAELSPPGLVTVGQEHLHFSAYTRPLRRAISTKYQRLDALAVLTEADRSEYERFLDRRVRLVRIPNSVGTPAGRTADLAAPRILAAGRLNQQKGFDLLLDAFAPVASERPEWHLLICGQGALRAPLRRRAEELGLGGRAELPGPCRDLQGEMVNASVFVLSSRFEGFPLTLLEAMSVGMAVISFDCPTGPRDLVEDGRNGFLVPPEDVGALAEAIARVTADEALRRRLGAAALETARAYTMDEIGPQWEALLAGLARAPARTPQ
jgi:glycosyltransferase involved in cell wall biosynthesis